MVEYQLISSTRLEEMDGSYSFQGTLFDRGFVSSDRTIFFDRGSLIDKLLEP
jgi:hypothetical protein